MEKRRNRKEVKEDEESDLKRKREKKTLHEAMKTSHEAIVAWQRQDLSGSGERKGPENSC